MPAGFEIARHTLKNENSTSSLHYLHPVTHQFENHSKVDIQPSDVELMSV